jgi:hypothetical protein
MLKSEKRKKPLVIGLLVVLVAAAPVQASKVGDWLRAHKADIATVGGVVMSIVDPALIPVGAALVGLQGSMLSTTAHIAADPVLARGFATLQLCEDGSLSCDAAQGLLQMEVRPLEVADGETPEVAAFVKAANRVTEEGNVFARHCRENAPLAVKQQDLRVMASSLAAAADAFDRLGLPFEVSQADIDNFQKETRTSGLPRIEKAFWQDAGLSPAEVEDVARFLGTEDLRMPAPSVSMSDVLHTAAASFGASSR